MQVSKDAALGGIFWRKDGKELYFFNLVGLVPNALMAADLAITPEVQTGVPRMLFRLTGVTGPAQVSNIASGDGERFVFLPPAPVSPPR